jgi:hypothetical protein
MSGNKPSCPTGAGGPFSGDLPAGRGLTRPSQQEALYAARTAFGGRFWASSGDFPCWEVPRSPSISPRALLSLGIKPEKPSCPAGAGGPFLMAVRSPPLEKTGFSRSAKMSVRSRNGPVRAIYHNDGHSWLVPQVTCLLGGLLSQTSFHAVVLGGVVAPSWQRVG